MSRLHALKRIEKLEENASREFHKTFEGKITRKKLLQREYLSGRLDMLADTGFILTNLEFYTKEGFDRNRSYNKKQDFYSEYCNGVYVSKKKLGKQVIMVDMNKEEGLY